MILEGTIVITTTNHLCIRIHRKICRNMRYYCIIAQVHITLCL